MVLTQLQVVEARTLERDRTFEFAGTNGKARRSGERFVASKRRARGRIADRAGRAFNARQASIARGGRARFRPRYALCSRLLLLACLLGFHLRIDEEILPPDENEYRQENGDEEVAVVTHEDGLSRNRNALVWTDGRCVRPCRERRRARGLDR